ncbi:MAG: sigma-54 dependent transcriptional regulator [Myxococcota bacterium]|jgi:two-component system response regulator HydG|nr:sigma-54 dependent transcriptional regulator [Myxococcota bacterium]
MNTRVLIVDDDRSLCQLLADELSELGFVVDWRTSAEEALASLRDLEPDVVVTDLRMRGLSGLELCGRIVAGWPELPVIVITAFGSLETAIAAIRSGAYDFITKPFETEALAVALNRAAERRALRAEVRRLRSAVLESHEGGGLLGSSPPMQQIYRLLDRLGPAEAPVLITGESGTGKELVALELHRRSRRAAQPFVAVNCAALPEALLESELFGHVRGAFTDARTARSGLFLEADRGTLFLDEIGEMPQAMQAKLLRALQSRTVRPVGGDVEIPCDVRVVSATNKDIEAATAAGSFRTDLYFRVNVLRIDLPPLRARGNDILVLAQHFLRRAARRELRQVSGIGPEAARKLLDYSWPGNVRELQNVIERAVALTRGEEILVEDLPEAIQRHRRRDLVLLGDTPDSLPTLAEVERRYIQLVLDTVGQNKARAARILGMDRTTLYRRLGRGGAESGDPGDLGGLLP